MSWNEQYDVTKLVRWGTLQPDDIPDNVYLVKAKEHIIGKTKSVIVKEFTDDDGNPVMRYNINMVLGDIKDNKFVAGEIDVRFITPSRLQTDLGLNPTWKKDKVLAVDDVLMIEYQGRNKDAKGKPHLFHVQFWE